MNLEFLVKIVLWVSLPKFVFSSIISSEYKLVGNFPANSVSSLWYYGSGLALNPVDGNLVLFHRADRMYNKPNDPNIPIQTETVYVIHKESGEILDKWGANMFFHPHGITIDHNGHLYLTDSKLHQVFKYAYNETSKLWDPEPILTLGQRFESGNDQEHFCTPAAVAVEESTGDIFIADGYCNSRIVKFNHAGQFLLEWGAGGVPNIPFNISHGITLGKESEEIIFLADRDNGRIQAFSTTNGQYLYQLGPENFFLDGSINMLLNVAHSEKDGGTLYAVNGNMPYGTPAIFEITYDRSRAHVRHSFPVSKGQAGNTRNQVPHGMISTKDGSDLYVVEGRNNLTIWKYSLRNQGLRNASGYYIHFLTLIIIFAVKLF